MSLPCIITVAITGSLPQKRDNPAVPISVQEQIESTHEAFEAGASLVHLHVRNDDGTPTSSAERFGQVMEGIRAHCPGMIVQFSTGGRSGAGKERGAHLGLKPDMGSLAPGSVNFPTRVYDGHCRTGLEDNVRLDRDTLAPSNAALVREVVRLCEQAGRPPATPIQARDLLRL